METPSLHIPFLRRNALACWIVLLCAVAIPSHAATITVTNTNDSGGGSLRQAIIDASDGDTINFAVTGAIGLTSGELLVDSDITISGPGAASLAMDGNANSRVFHIASGTTVSISGLTIRNGSASDNGAGIYNDHATLTLGDCTISGNSAAGDGGGIFNDQAILMLSDCAVSGNSANYGGGGGIYNDGDGYVSLFSNATLTISNCAISANTAHVGGGIYNDGFEFGDAVLTVNNSTFRGNSADFGGGGIYNDGFDLGNAVLTVNSSTFRGNSANYGGGIYNDGDVGSASVTLNDSDFNSNSADSSGGGIYNYGYWTTDALLTLNNSTLSSNSADESGGSIYNNHGTLTLDNSAISGNSAQNWGGGIYNDGSAQGAARLTITSSTLNGNSAATGGGIFNDGEQGTAHLLVSDSTLSRNAASYGGGIASDSYCGYYLTMQISNCTLASNSASQAGGGIYNVAAGGQYVMISLANTILKAGAVGANIFSDSSTITSLGYNLSNDDGGGFLTGSGDQINTDPMLGPLQDNGGPTFTHELLPDSPAIDAGDPSFTPPPFYDQRGPSFDRVVNGRIDIGSFEVQGPTPITLSAAGRKVGGINTVRLTWSGATSANIDVYRDAVLIVTTANDGSHIDSTGDAGRARYTYRVCEAGAAICSNAARLRSRQ